MKPDEVGSGAGNGLSVRNDGAKVYGRAQQRESSRQEPGGEGP